MHMIRIVMMLHGSCNISPGLQVGTTKQKKKSVSLLILVFFFGSNVLSSALISKRFIC